MPSVTYRDRQGRAHTLPEADLASFQDGLRGRVFTPESDGYEEARIHWNGMIDKRPAIIVRCRGSADVTDAVRFAREHDMRMAVRGGGHNVAGSALCDEGLVVDLTEMDSVRVSPGRKVAWVEGGARWGAIDRESQAFGLATPGGLDADTGVAGLTLGGGYGWLSRRFGLACDHVLSADVMTAEGELLHVSEIEHPDLYWGIRGGGGNLGIVTTFELQLHEVGPEVMLLCTYYPRSEAEQVLRAMRDQMADAPRTLFTKAIMTYIPDVPPFPEAHWGEPTVALFGLYSGDMAQADEVVGPFRALAEPLIDRSDAMTYVQAQLFFDGNYPYGRHYYWKSTMFEALPDEAIDAYVAQARLGQPSPISSIDLWFLGGAISDVEPSATAYWNRDKPFMLNAVANWEDATQTSENVAWARGVIASMQPYAAGAMYANFPGTLEEASQAAQEAYGGNYARLVELKTKYDPTNLFNQNVNIRPRPLERAADTGAG